MTSQHTIITAGDGTLIAPPAPGADECAAAGSADTAQRLLEDLRAQLDETDARLLEDLRQRLEICGRIGLHKKRHGIAMMQPARIGIVQQRAAAFAALHGLNVEFLHVLYALIIEETCRLEDEIIGAQQEAR